MKLVLFQPNTAASPRPGIWIEAGIVDVGDLVGPAPDTQSMMVGLIDRFDELRPELDHAIANRIPTPVEQVRLLPPLPRPGKMLNCIGNYWENRERDAAPLNMFLKNPDAVIGPGDTIELPDFEEPSSFMHEAELALVLKGPAKHVPAERWRDAVFGYTCAIDVTARGEGRFTWKKLSWLGKSFDTFAPLGPCIVTADEIADPNDLRVRLWSNGELHHDYHTSDMEHRVPALVEFVTRLMTVRTGDVISCGTNHQGLGYIQHGDRLRMEIGSIGVMEVEVTDPLKRRWDTGVYMGQDSTNHDAIRKHRPDLEKSLR